MRIAVKDGGPVGCYLASSWRKLEAGHHRFRDHPADALEFGDHPRGDGVALGVIGVREPVGCRSAHRSGQFPAQIESVLNVKIHTLATDR